MSRYTVTDDTLPSRYTFNTSSVLTASPPKSSVMSTTKTTTASSRTVTNTATTTGATNAQGSSTLPSIVSVETLSIFTVGSTLPSSDKMTSEVLHSTKISDNTSYGIPSIPNDSTIDQSSIDTAASKNTSYDVVDEFRTTDTSYPVSGPSSDSMTASSSSTFVTEMGPHPEDDITEVIYGDRGAISQLVKLDTTKWFSSTLLCTHESAAHKLLIVSMDM